MPIEKAFHVSSVAAVSCDNFESTGGAMMAKDLTTVRIGRNDHVFTWERTRKTTFRGAKRDILKALTEHLKPKIEDPLVVQCGY